MCLVVPQAIQGGYENKEDKRERRDLNHLLGLTCKKLRAKMPTNLLYRERPELKAQEAKEAAEKAASGSATDAKETGNLLIRLFFSQSLVCKQTFFALKSFDLKSKLLEKS